MRLSKRSGRPARRVHARHRTIVRSHPLAFLDEPLAPVIVLPPRPAPVLTRSA